MKRNIKNRAFFALTLSSLLACNAYAMSMPSEQDSEFEITQEVLDQGLFNALIKKQERPAVCLLAKGANLATAMANKFDANSIDPVLLSSLLISTVHLNSPTITQALLNARADIDFSRAAQTALTTAIRSGAPKSVQALLDTAHLSQEQRRALQSAALARQTELNTFDRQSFASPEKHSQLLATAAEITALLGASPHANIEQEIEQERKE